ncbi:interferon-related developmental regulator 1 [Aricia agestis]|uniref:interferon-related developmental regulator 1 n=1 Tax=Aricia agestis TaxID=91739 RepID=UPI001C20B229|nr:interferon-related developmental regulator 1 [Aricia agestis]
MPKGKKKGKSDHRRTEVVYSSDEDAGIDMTTDNLSETSGQSDLRSNHDEAESEMQEKFEEKVMEVIDGLGAKSAAARAGALTSLRTALTRRHLGSLLCSHRATLADHVARALKRGKDVERRAAAAIAPLLALQIGDEGTEEYISEVRPALFALATDKSASLDTRAECCSSLAVLCYLLEEDLSIIMDVMNMYETIFSGSYLKGDGSVKVCGDAVECGGWHAAALDGWALLLPLAPAVPSVARMAGLLHAPSLEVRMSAGTALAVAAEALDSDGDEPLDAELLAALRALASDSHKYRAKRDRKLQRATFRDILKYFEDDEVPELRVRVGGECVVCDTWSSRCAYEALAAALGGALYTLAPHSPTLRAALELPPAPACAAPQRKLNKLQRHLQNTAACKARTVARNKSRDKRSAALSM